MLELKVGHHYKRTYIDNSYIIFTVVKGMCDPAYVKVNVLKSRDDTDMYIVMIRIDFKNTKTIEIDEIKLATIML